MKDQWWKALGVVFVLYSIIMGFLGKVPALPILHETIRNLYFHVTMWFSMIIILTVSVINSIRFIAKNEKGFNLDYDIIAHQSASVGLLLGLLGLATGSVWANYTWGAPWTDDPKLNGAAAGILFYVAYFILRSSIDDTLKKARISAIYNIFAYVMLMVFIMILPRLTDSLHPGNGGNPGFGGYDLDKSMRMVFYPAIIGWSLIGWWMVTLQIRITKIKQVHNVA
jgi:heme exporter protein C